MKSFLDDVDDFLKDRFLVFCIVSSVIILWMSFSSQSLFFIPSAGFFDETENLHASWLVYRGYIPYRDFFEHHTPLTWYVLSPLFNFYMDDIRILNTGKYIMLFLSALDLVVVYSISRQYMGVKPSLLAVTLLATQYNFFLNMSKIYNEAFLIFFTLLSFRFLLAGLKNKSNTWFFLAGTAMGIGFGFKQTAAILFLAIPAAVIARRHFNHGRKDSAIVGAALSFAGFIVPVMALFYFFHANSALGDFVYHVFLLNIKTNSANIGARIFDFSRVNSDILFWLPAYLCLLGDVKKIFHRTIKLERLVLVLYIAAGHISLLTSAPFPTYRLIILAVFMTLYAADYITKLFIHGRRSLAVSMVLFAVMNPILSISAYQVDLDIHGLMSPRPNGEFYDFLYGHVGENDAVFDFMGEHIYRKHAYPIWFFYDFRGNYMDMNSSEYENMPYELGKAQPKAMIDAPDKYLSRLSSENLVFLDENFRCVLESAGHRIFVPSKTVDSEMLDDGFEDFEILTSGAYVVEKKCGKIWVDNSEAGGEVYLESGPHHLEKTGNCYYVTFTLKHPQVSEKNECNYQSIIF